MPTNPADGQPTPTSPSLPTTVGNPALGRFRDFLFHAKGGLGEVYRALDADLHRTVAVKRLQDRHADSPDSQRRFLLEAEVTARLEHPGVVPVYSISHDEQGRPSYSMRFIEGQTFAEAIAAYHTAIADRVAFRRLLQSFIHVCQTVAYAHSRGVIHRDLKPQNLMLGKFGETLVVDWGLAKVVGRSDAERLEGSEGTLQPVEGSGGETKMGTAVGTPAYMSPEQAAGRWDVITPASDVYSLGAVLYTLLTGRPPFAGGNWPELQQKIQRGDYPRPRKVRPDVPRPLEAVCLKAMAADPQERYSSAQALATDVERWLAAEPVSAFRDPLITKIARWARRNRTVASAAAALLIAAVVASAVGLVILGQKNQEIAAQRDAERKAKATAEAVNAFLTDDLLGQADPDRNGVDKKITVVELLHKAQEKIDNNNRFADQPETEATLRLTLGKTFFNLGVLPEAEKDLRRAVELRRQTPGLDRPETLAAQEALADFLNRGLYRYAEAEPLARQTWESRQRVLGPEHSDTLDSLDTYAQSLGSLGRKSEAADLLQQCLKARQRILGPKHPDTLTTMNNLAIVLGNLGRDSDGIELLREVLRIRKDEGAVPSEIISASFNLAMAQYRNGELTEADQILTQEIARSSQILGPTHPNTDRLRGLSVSVWIDEGYLEKAATRAAEVVALRRQIHVKFPPMTALALADLGRAQTMMGRFADAESNAAEASYLFKKNPPPDDYYAAWADCWYGVCLVGLARYEEAKPLLLDAEKRLRSNPLAPLRHRRLAVEQLIHLYEAWGQPEEAAKWKANLSPQ